jgi:hypothetical protein
MQFQSFCPLHCIFFDDNILYDDSHIVDFREAETGEPIPFE